MRKLKLLVLVMMVISSTSALSETKYHATLYFKDGSKADVRTKYPSRYSLKFNNERMKIDTSDIREIKVIDVDYTRSKTDRSPSGKIPKHEYVLEMKNGKVANVSGRLCNIEIVKENPLSGKIEEKKFYFHGVRNYAGNICTYDPDNIYNNKTIIRVVYHH